MSEHVLFLVRATGHHQRGLAVVWIGWQTAQERHVWRWEVLRLHWESMGTSNTAAWVAEQFAQRDSPALFVETDLLCHQIQQALHVVERTWPLPA